MTIFETVKSSVPLISAAERYGLTANRSGMACCPFHDDRHPSLKLNEHYYYCFGCGAKGDVVDFTARLFGVSALDAAKKLAADFGISEGKTSVLEKLQSHKTQYYSEKLCCRVLDDYLSILNDWKERYAPRTHEEPFHPRFVEAYQMFDCIKFMVDLLTEGEPDVRRELVQDLMKDDKINRLHEQVQKIREEGA